MSIDLLKSEETGGLDLTFFSKTGVPHSSLVSALVTYTFLTSPGQ